MSDTKKITVKEFVKKYNALSNDKLKESQIDSVIKRNYAPILEKRAVLEAAFEKSIQEKDGIKYVDSVLAQIGLFCAVLTLYTTLDYKHTEEDTDNVFTDYDLLMESGIYPVVMYKVGERDIKELMNIYSSIEETFMNQQTFEAYLAKQVTRFGELFGRVGSAGMEAIAKVLNDDEKMNALTGKLTEMMETGKRLNIIK